MTCLAEVQGHCLGHAAVEGLGRESGLERRLCSCIMCIDGSL